MLWFKKNDTQDNLQEEDNKIIFSIKNNKIVISLEVNPDQNNIAEQIGKLFYEINSGNLEEPMAKTLLDISEKNPELNTFVQNILEHWIIQRDSLSSKPYVSPLKVFQQ